MEKTAVKWTPMQSAAINIKNKTLLISAAAGSGKTAVLTERIIKRLCDKDEPADISRMLIVTFTKAAASELKTRISKAIGKAIADDPLNRHLTRQLLLLSSAKICTIHSFCLDIVKKNLKSLGLPEGVTVSDESETALLSHDIMNNVINDAYNGVFDEGFEAENFTLLADMFSQNGSDDGMCDSLLELYNKLSSYPEGIEFLRICAEDMARDSEMPFFETEHGKIIVKELASHAEYLLGEYRLMCEEVRSDETVFSKYAGLLSDETSLLEALSDELIKGLFDYAKKTVTAFEFTKLPSLPRGYSTPLSDKYKKLRDELKKYLREALTPTLTSNNDELAEMSKKSSALLFDLYRILHRFDRCFREEKKRISKLDFVDIERYTYELLIKDGNPTETAHEISRMFDEVYIDEYQDTNSVQDMIFAAISRSDNRFMVGDIKQSIYSFRGAAPENFARYRDTFEMYSIENESTSLSNTVFLSNNFRCDSTVVDFCNTVFSCIFRNATGRVAYYDSDNLVCSKSDGKDSAVPVKVVLAEKPKDCEETTVSEAEYIAREARRLIDCEKKKDGSPITASDIAVLVRANASSIAIEKELNKLGIQTSNKIATEFFENSEILLVMSLLNAIDNPMRDIYLAGVLKSPLFNFTLDELVTIRASSRASTLYEALVAYTENAENNFEKGKFFLDRLDYFRTLASGTQVDRLLRKLYRETSLFAIVSAQSPDGTPPEEARENLMLLYKYARDFEGSSFKGLSSFIKYVDDIIAQKTKLAGASSKAPANDTVRIMTIHQSKGLEFPIVFVAAAGKTSDSRDKNPPVLTDRNAGASIDLPGLLPGTRIKTLHRRALEIRMDENRYEEEMRVLYVALTRARERLYVTGEFKDPAAEYEKAKNTAENICPHVIMKKLSYMQLVLIPIIAAGYESPERCEIVFPKQEDNKTPTFECNESTSEPDPTFADELLKRLKEHLEFQYPHAAALDIPSKLSVSELYEGILDKRITLDGDADGTKSLTERLCEITPRFISEEKETLTPSAAERGTATHVFMQFCDFKSAEQKGIDFEIERMLAMGFISPETAVLIDRARAAAFFKSSLYLTRIKSAASMWREYRFNVQLPAAQFTNDDNRRESLKDEWVFVQGIIDCFTENDDGTYTLIDYKTDRIPFDLVGNEDEFTELLINRHASQLTYYKRALEIIIKKPVREVLIYSFALGRAVDITSKCQ